jgi:hypothetical protein
MINVNIPKEMTIAYHSILPLREQTECKKPKLESSNLSTAITWRQIKELISIQVMNQQNENAVKTLETAEDHILKCELEGRRVTRW